ncbi:MAG TPA: SUMF1/EgtB/PvdO family nonheme iron enzyme [Anaerolineae bacterium]|nr:SUMF1/EgtB/PvdO family nonheme iron enzyme [Anaerolineae bacterium]
MGSFLGGASWCGALEMGGNAWEWVADWYGAYPASGQAEPTGPASGSTRVARGGSCQEGRAVVRGAFRTHYDPDYPHWDLGFRCAAPAAPRGP